jgi:hypothetical protein
MIVAKGGSRMVDWGGGGQASAPRRRGLAMLGGEAPTFEGPREVGGVLAPPQKFFFEFFAQNGTFSCILKHYF